MGVKSYNISAMKYKSSIRNISHTLNLISVGRNHSGTYYCTGWTEIPVLGPKIYGTGTELIVEELPSSCSVDANVTIPTSQYTLLMSLLSFLLITVSITSVTCIMCKGRRRTPNKTKHPKQMCDLEAVQTGVGLPLSVSSDVLYAALTPPRAPETIRTHMISPDPANTDVLYSTIHITPKIMEQMVIPDTPDGV
ncbi:uncharacterized protein si:dkey-63d15.12 isoform X1 [Electrophorus electricus]|uniref:uncharacterized protein si:dkey-63d15.12 isoform X1 n=1 Tax=Electrophorus electricus TaxID=8005 RepID=UPI0015CFA52F|nr:uncharacterized protein si:dkey-63d15.12 isoform X1 [Electrophorus electricus]